MNLSDKVSLKKKKWASYLDLYLYVWIHYLFIPNNTFDYICNHKQVASAKNVSMSLCNAAVILSTVTLCFRIETGSEKYDGTGETSRDGD